MRLHILISFPTISEEDACRALYEEVSEHCCYGTGAVENLVITNIHSSSAFHVSNAVPQYNIIILL